MFRARCDGTYVWDQWASDALASIRDYLKPKNKNMRTIDRLANYLKEKGITPYEFEHKLDISNGYLGKMVKSKNGSIGSNVIEKIIEHYPMINIQWLFTGQGESEIFII